jgi:hypothetical protein
VVCISDEGNSWQEEAFLRGAEAFMAKPVDFDDLLGTLLHCHAIHRERLMNQRRRLHETHQRLVNF